MSRSNPTENIPNPATRWYEWSGSKGNLKFWDKTEKVNVEVDLPFEFILLDQLSSIKGWHDASEANIYANEVRDTRDEPFIVRSFKMKDSIVEGIYSEVKDSIKANGGHFVSSLYIAFTDDEAQIDENGNDVLPLVLGNLQFHGAALRAWMEFSGDKGVRPYLYKSAVKIGGAVTGKKGSITFKVPKFELVVLDQETNDKATALDVELQKYLRSYFKRSRVEQADPVTSIEDEDEAANRELQEAEEVPF